MRWSLLRNQQCLKVFRTLKTEGLSFDNSEGTEGTVPAIVGGKGVFTAFLEEGGRELRVARSFCMGVKIDMMVV
jgi:hypothetical protein